MGGRGGGKEEEQFDERSTLGVGGEAGWRGRAGEVYTVRL
jgi:hypothetical protein